MIFVANARSSHLRYRRRSVDCGYWRIVSIALTNSLMHEARHTVDLSRIWRPHWGPRTDVQLDRCSNHINSGRQYTLPAVGITMNRATQTSAAVLSRGFHIIKRTHEVLVNVWKTFEIAFRIGLECLSVYWKLSFSYIFLTTSKLYINGPMVMASLYLNV